jgi:hypothetical protein
LLGGCWGGPNFTPLEIVSPEPTAAASSESGYQAEQYAQAAQAPALEAQSAFDPLRIHADP